MYNFNRLEKILSQKYIQFSFVNKTICLLNHCTHSERMFFVAHVTQIIWQAR